METPDDFPQADNQKYYTLNNDTWFNAEIYMAEVEEWFAEVLNDDEPEPEGFTLENLGNTMKDISDASLHFTKAVIYLGLAWFLWRVYCIVYL